MSGRPTAPKLRRINMGHIFIVLAVVSGLVTILIFKGMMSGRSNTNAPVEVTSKTHPVVVAQVTLHAGEPLDGTKVKVIDWPADQYPQGDVFDSIDKVSGRAVRTDVFSGQPIYRQALTGESSGGGLPVVIPKGYRAMTILVTENKGVAGFIKPGDHVDVLGTFDYHIPEASQKTLSGGSGVLMEDSFHVTETVLQDIRVLAIAQEMLEDSSAANGAGSASPAGSAAAGGSSSANASAPPPASNGPSGANPDVTKGRVVSSITVAVTPQQAEKLTFADSRGDLRLTLRPEEEHSQLPLIGAVSNDVVPYQSLVEKVSQMVDSMRGSWSGSASSAPDFPPPPSGPAYSAPPPPAAASVLPPAPAKSGHEVQVLEGTTSNTISF